PPTSGRRRPLAEGCREAGEPDGDGDEQPDRRDPQDGPARERGDDGEQDNRGERHSGQTSDRLGDRALALAEDGNEDDPCQDRNEPDPAGHIGSLEREPTDDQERLTDGDEDQPGDRDDGQERGPRRGALAGQPG